jgi:hypothetical protein
LPHSCRSRYPSGPAQLGGFRPFAETAAKGEVVLQTVIPQSPTESLG